MRPQRDAMVFEVDFTAEEQTHAAPVRARGDRLAHRTTRKGGLFDHLATVQKYRRARRALFTAGRAARALGWAERGAGAALETAMTRAGARVAVGNPVGAIVAAVIVAGVVALRLGTGQPLEGTGEAVNRMILGDADDKARASMAVRQRYSDDPVLSRILAQKGLDANNGLPADLAKMSAGDVQIELEKERGASLFREHLGVNNTLDMLILRAAEKLKQAWRDFGGPAAVDGLHRNYQNRIAGAGKNANRGGH